MSKHYTDEDALIVAQKLARAEWNNDPFVWDALNEKGHRRYIADAQSLLDAVAPAIAARALREAADAIADGVEPTNSPNYSRDDAQDERVIEELRARADAIAHLFPADVRRNLAARRADEIEAGR